MTGGIALAPLLTQIKVDLKSFKSDMDKAASIGVAKSKEISKSLTNTAKIGGELKKIGSGMTKHVTLPIAAVGTASAKMALDYEKSFAKVTTLLDSNIVNFDKYKKDIIIASDDSGVAVDKFSEAVYQSISAGVDQRKAIEFTTEAMKLAKGGFTEGSKAVDVITTAINGYKLKTEDATRVSDLLITTQNLGKTTVDELSESMGKVIPIAANNNFSIEELSAAYATLTKNGIATAEAGTYTRQMLSELSKSGSTADKALRELSSKGFAELKAEGVPTTDILKMLNKYAEDNGMTLKDMFGSVEAGTAAMVLFNGKGKEYNEILGKMNDSTGATDEAFNKMEQTAGAKLSKSINKLKNRMIEFGGVLTPIIESASNLLGKLSDKLSGLSEEQMKMIAKLGMVAMVIGPVLSGLGSMIIKYTELKPIIGGATAAIKSSGGVIAALTSPIGIAIAAMVLLTVAVATNFGGIRDSITSIMHSIASIISSVLGIIKKIWSSNFLGIRTITQTIFDNIKTIFSTVFAVIANIFKIFASAFKGDWKGVWEGVKGIFSSIWKGIQHLMGNFLNILIMILVGAGSRLWAAAKSAFGKIKDGFKNVWSSIKSWFSEAVNDPVGTLKGIGDSLFNAGKSVFSSMWDGMKSIWSSITGWVEDKVNWLKDKVSFWKKESGKMKTDGSHYTGLSYVPFDNYIARLHKGERVLTAEENKSYMQGKSNSSSVNVTNNFYGKVESPYEVSKATKKSMRNLQFS